MNEEEQNVEVSEAPSSLPETETQTTVGIVDDAEQEMLQRIRDRTNFQNRSEYTHLCGCGCRSRNWVFQYSRHAAECADA